jgi:hypothetical protein
MHPTDPEAIARQVVDACIVHARRMLASQMPIVDSRNYDFLPAFSQMTTQMYLVGVIWRFGEQFALPTAPRERGFLCLFSMLVSDGMNTQEAQRRVAELNRLSRSKDGHDNPAVLAGYRATEADGSLAEVFEAFRNVPAVAGAPFRLINRAKPISAILAAAGFGIAVVLGRSWAESLGISVVLGVVPLVIALALYRRSVKANAQPK